MAELSNPITADGDQTVTLSAEAGRYGMVVNYTAGTGTIKAQWDFAEGAMDIPGASFTADGAVEFIVPKNTNLNINTASASSLSATVRVFRIY